MRFVACTNFHDIDFHPSDALKSPIVSLFDITRAMSLTDCLVACSFASLTYNIASSISSTYSRITPGFLALVELRRDKTESFSILLLLNSTNSEKVEVVDMISPP